MIVPSAVPKAIVKTGMPAAAASWAPTSVGTPDGRLAVAQQHDRPRRRTGGRARRIGGRWPAVAGQAHQQLGAGRQRVADRRDSASWRSSMPPSSAVAVERRAHVERRRAAERDQADLDVVRRPGRRSRLAACWAAASRLGDTSVANIDSDTSNSRRIRPSLPMRSVVRSTGRAMATTPSGQPEQLQARDDVAAPRRAAAARSRRAGRPG